MKLSLHSRLLGGFLLVGSVTLVIGVFGWLSVHRITQAMHDRGELENAAEMLAQRQVDHFLWAQKTGAFQYDSSVSAITVETDPGKCAFGKWFFGDERKHLVALIPEVGPVLERIETSHRLLHESAKQIDVHLRDGANGRQQALDLYKTGTLSHLGEVRNVFEAVRPIVAGRIATIAAKADAQARIGSRVIGIVSTAGAGAAVLLGFLLSRWITSQLRRNIASMHEASAQVSAAANQVSSASQSLAEGSCRFTGQGERREASSPWPVNGRGE